MLPVEEFDSPDALRERFQLLCGRGAASNRFHAIDEPPMSVIAGEAGRSARATMQVPTSTSFFGDHFPRRAVFPATLLLNAQMRLALQLAQAATPARAAATLFPSRMTNVKMRSFILPGQTVEIAAEMAPSQDDTLTTLLSASVEGRKVATARLEIKARSTP